MRWTLSGGDSADFYLINITTNAPQTPYGGLLNITIASVTQYKLTSFMADYEYNITVRGVNCGSQEGRESEPLKISPQGITSDTKLYLRLEFVPYLSLNTKAVLDEIYSCVQTIHALVLISQSIPRRWYVLSLATTVSLLTLTVLRVYQKRFFWHYLVTLISILIRQMHVVRLKHSLCMCQLPM